MVRGMSSSKTAIPKYSNEARVTDTYLANTPEARTKEWSLT